MVTWAVPQRHVLTSSKTCLSLLLLKITKINNYPQIAKYMHVCTCTLLARKQKQIILLASQLPVRCQLESSHRLFCQLATCQQESTIRLFCQLASQLYVVSQKVQLDYSASKLATYTLLARKQKQIYSARTRDLCNSFQLFIVSFSLSA